MNPASSVFTLICFSATLAAQKKPNIILILADDLGYGDLGCYGQKIIQTPNIDLLARQGMRFTQHYAGTTVSAPSRCCLLTGMHSGHAEIRGNKNMQPEGQWPLSDSVITFPQLLQNTGYNTGCFGKWGLGFHENSGSPLKKGFNTFFGYYCQSRAHRHYPDYLWNNTTKIKLNNHGSKIFDYAPDIIHRQALYFIEKNKDSLFFAFLSYTLPHAELIAPEDTFIARYRNRLLPEKKFIGSDYSDSSNFNDYTSQNEAHATYAAMISRLDKYVGDILEKIISLGIDSSTLILFTSDNGPHLEGGADPDYFNSNGNLRGYKRDLFEGGIRIPLIARFPGKIIPGSVNSLPSAFWDWMPTFCEMADIPCPEGIDGISLYNSLLGKPNKEHDFLYWEFHEQNGKQALRIANWKAIRLNINLNPTAPVLLFDLLSDPYEKNNIASLYPERVQEMTRIMMSQHIPENDFLFDFEKNVHH